MARYLEEELKASETKHCETCLCVRRDLTVLAHTSAQSYTVGTQTLLHGDANNSLCLRCNNNLNSPSRTNSPYIMKLVKSSDSVISETKSSVSGSNDNDKLFVPAKKDDLTVNPILGHHRLCDRPPKLLNTDESDDLSMSYQQPKMLHSLPAPIQKKSPTQLKSSEHFAQHSNSNYAGASRNGCNRSDRMGNETGSTNSLWSKGSSSNANNNSSADGARMFETFNRNLIKSIKVREIGSFFCWIAGHKFNSIVITG